MKYELSIFQQVIQGSLSPMYFPVELYPIENIDHWYEQLQQPPAEAVRQIHVQFQKVEEAFVIHTLQVQLINPYESPTFQNPNHPVEIYQEQEILSGEALLVQVLKHLALSREAVLDWYHWQDEQQQVHLELYARCPLAALTPEERRYHYYQWLLLEQVGIVQQRMLAYVHQATSRKKASKYVQDHQQALLVFTSQVLQYLDEESPQVYTFTGDYNLPDVYRLIFMSLEQLISYVEEHFLQYLDTTAPAPYRRRVLQFASLTKQLDILQLALQQSSVEAALLKVLEEPFEQIRQLHQREVSYRQLHYYQKLLQALEGLVKDQPTPTDELVAALLFRLNFNDAAFLQWLADDIAQRLATVNTIEEKRSLLYYYRKHYKQLPLQPEDAYQYGQAVIDEQILAWISEEIRYWEQESVAQHSLTNKESSNQRIKTTMTVAQIALLLRLFREVNLFPRQNQANVFRQFSSILYSLKQEEVSADSLRGKYAQHDSHTIDVLKDKVIAMLHFLQTL